MACGTARGDRSARELFLDLNQPIRSKTRPQVAPDPPVPPPRPRIPPQKLSTDACRFRSVDDKTLSIDSIIKSTRRDRASELQSWIDSDNPPPIDILRRIAALSPPHSRVLTLIADELSRFPAADLREPLVDLDADAVDELTSVAVRTHDLTRRAEELQREAEALRAQLARAIERRDAARTEWERYRRLIDAATFHEVGNRGTGSTRVQTGEGGRAEATMYNGLWGENKHLRGEIEKIDIQIEEHRKYHREYTAQRALAAYEAETARDAEKKEPE
jgi:cell division septum initiation protein DivIVA